MEVAALAAAAVAVRRRAAVPPRTIPAILPTAVPAEAAEWRVHLSVPLYLGWLV